MRTALAWVLTGCWLTACAAAGAGFQHALEIELGHLSDDDRLSVILVLYEQAPLGEIDSRLKRTRSTRRERHTQVVEALHEVSRSQAPLLATLAEGYTHRIRTRTTPGPFPPETPVYSGSADWHEVHCDLSPYSGTVRLRYRFGTDVTGARAGWCSDDVLVGGFRIDFAQVAPEPGEGLAFRVAEGSRLIYRLPEPSSVELQLFDTGGRWVRTLFRGDQSAGWHELVWNGPSACGQPMPAGIYLSRLRVGAGSATQKLLLRRGGF